VIDRGERIGAERLRRLPEPEVVVAALATVLLLSVLVVGSLPRDDGSPATPTDAPATPTAAVRSPPARAVDTALIALLTVVNQRLRSDAQALSRELEADPLRTADVAAIIRQLNATARFGTEAASQLGGTAGEADIAARLTAVYQSIRDTATLALSASLSNLRDYRLAAGVLVDQISVLPEIQAALDLLAEGEAPSISPDPSKPPPSPTAIATADPDEQLVNGDFEDGVGPPWELRVGPGAAASLLADPTVAASGTRSARVEISVATQARSAITLRQDGLALMAGGRYVLRVSVRSAQDREIGIRIASRDGATYLTRVVGSASSWTTVSYLFSAPVSDEDAVVEITVGRSAVTTWVDAVSFRAAPAETPRP
jgi:hypothetical protein